MMDRENEDHVKKVVREGYKKVVKEQSSCCAPVASSCCGGASKDTSRDLSKRIGYSEAELDSIPDGADMGLGCGNPVAMASLKEGEVVLDLGSGPGLDCFLAANKVGRTGRVIGVDMTQEMLDKARENARTGEYHNVEFRLGEIENLPVADSSVDVVISNCVINLSPRKDRVFQEAFRVLRPGGRLMVSDIVVLKELPEFIQRSAEAYVGCLSGAILKDEYLDKIGEAGFKDVKVVGETYFPIDMMLNDALAQAIIKDLDISKEQIDEIARSILSIKVTAFKQ